MSAAAVAQTSVPPPLGMTPEAWARLTPDQQATLRADQADMEANAITPEQKAAALKKDTATSAIASVKMLLKDPESAKFRGIKRQGPFGYCGWVNAKNSFGGYTGYSVFLATDKATVIIPPELSEPSIC